MPHGGESRRTLATPPAVVGASVDRSVMPDKSLTLAGASEPRGVPEAETTVSRADPVGVRAVAGPGAPPGRPLPPGTWSGGSCSPWPAKGRW